MKQDAFQELAWRLEEILVTRDRWSRQVGACGGECNGYEGIDEEGLCHSCAEAYARVIAEDDKLANDEELVDVMKRLRQACDEDESGLYQKILDKARGKGSFTEAGSEAYWLVSSLCFTSSILSLLFREHRNGSPWGSQSSSSRQCIRP